MRRIGAVFVAALACLAGPAAADFIKITDKQQFVQIIEGRTLTRPLVSLEVRPDGAIKGRGAAWDVTGAWSWQDGFFCRDLVWGGSELGYNCQEVRVRAGREVRFTSDRGAGQSADFRLR